jgi:hypothetical protein
MNQREEEFDKRKREIQQSNNTAQETLKATLNELIMKAGSGGKDIREIQIPVALSGSLNFSALPINLKIVLSRLKRLEFIPGEITDIQGWMELKNISELNITRQLLTDLNLSTFKGVLNCKILNVEGNGLKEFDATKFMNLTQLNVAYNRFTKLAILPRTLEILDVRNNRLELLDLSRCAKIRYVNASNNTTQMVTVPPPLENTDYEIIQTSDSPYLAVEVVEEEPTVESSHKEKQEKRESAIRSVDYREALKEYFHYKTNYERKIAKEKRELWEKYRFGKKGSLSLTRQMLSRYVPTCLNCEQPGGMIFRFLPEEKKYKAFCGASHPCNFRIELYRSGDYMRITDIMEQEKQFSEECKQELITAKQDIFFGYVDELSGLKQSKKILEECEETETHIHYLEKEYEKLYSPERRKRIDELTLQMGLWITENKALISAETVAESMANILAGRRVSSRSLRGTDWEEDVTEEEEKGREEERIRMVVESEICQLFPLVKDLRNDKYDVMRTVLNDEDDEMSGCRLIQERVSFVKGEYNLDVEESSVLKYSVTEA